MRKRKMRMKTQKNIADDQQRRSPCKGRNYGLAQKAGNK